MPTDEEDGRRLCLSLYSEDFVSWADFLGVSQTIISSVSWLIPAMPCKAFFSSFGSILTDLS